MKMGKNRNQKKRKRNTRETKNNQTIPGKVELARTTFEQSL